LQIPDLVQIVLAQLFKSLMTFQDETDLDIQFVRLIVTSFRHVVFILTSVFLISLALLIHAIIATQRRQ
jgi:hypothetical protein